MGKRKPISQKLRFEVFKRDNFTCQYCGRSAPDVILEVDHINPVANGGENDLMNLVTSCKDCNRGKGAKKLTDGQEIIVEREKLQELNERRKQMQMMLQWREELSGLSDSETLSYEQAFSKLTGRTLTEFGKSNAKKFIKKYGLQLILDSLDTSFSAYAKRDNKGELTQESIDKVFNMVPRIAFHKQKGDLDPAMRQIYYCRGILRNRLHYIDEKKSLEYLKALAENDFTFEEIKNICLTVKSWMQFNMMMRELLAGEV